MHPHTHGEGWKTTEGKGPAFTRPAMRAGLCCASETMGADGWPAADVTRPVTDACERAHPPVDTERVSPGKGSSLCDSQYADSMLHTDSDSELTRCRLV